MLYPAILRKQTAKEIQMAKGKMAIVLDKSTENR